MLRPGSLFRRAAMLVLVSCGVVLADDVGVKRILIKDNFNPSKRQIQVQSFDPAIHVAPADDPTANGATMHVYSGTDDFCAVLSAADWKSTGNGWLYKNRVTKNAARITDGRIKLKVKSGVTYTLADDGTQGTVNVQVQFGSGTRYCMKCAGGKKNDGGTFLSLNCPAAPCEPELSFCDAASGSACGYCDQSGGLVTTTHTYQPGDPISLLACSCGLLDPACGAGTCNQTGYCDAACPGDPSCAPICYSPSSIVSQVMCGGQTIDGTCEPQPCAGAFSGQCGHDPATYTCMCNPADYDCGAFAILDDSDCDGVYDRCALCPAGTHAVDLDGDGCEEMCDCCPALGCLPGEVPTDTDGDRCPDQCRGYCQGALFGTCDGVSYAGNNCDPGHLDCGPNAIQGDNDCDGLYEVCRICPAGTHATDYDGDGCEDVCDCCPAAPTCSGGQQLFDGDGDGCEESCCSSLESCPCQPTGDGPRHLEEGETVHVTLRCQSGLALPGSSFQITNLPLGAVYDSGTATMTWTPGLAQANVYHLNVTVPSLETAQVQIDVADKFNSGSNVVVQNLAGYSEEYGLPVFFLYPAPTTDAYSSATLITGNQTFSVQARLHGASSMCYPKKSIQIKFQGNATFSDPSHDFFNKKRLIFISTFDDNSYMRQRMAYDVWNAMDPSHVPVHAYSAVLFVGTNATNVQYSGLYNVEDHIDDKYLTSLGEYPAGNLYKAIDHPASFYNAVSSTCTTPCGNSPCCTTCPPASTNCCTGFEKKDDPPLTGFGDLSQFVNFVMTASPSAFDSQIDSIIERQDYEDWWIFATFIRAGDSAGKNAYHYHRTAPPAKWRYLPWDFNDSLGQAWNTSSRPANQTEDFFANNQLFARLNASTVFGPPLRARYHQVLHDQFALPALLTRVDAYAAEIRSSALRDESKWGAQYVTYWAGRNRPFLTHTQEVADLRKWVCDRWTYQNALYP